MFNAWDNNESYNLDLKEEVNGIHLYCRQDGNQNNSNFWFSKVHAVLEC